MAHASIFKKPNFLFLILGGFFVANALLAEFIGVKIFSMESAMGFEPFDWTIFGVSGLGFNMTAGVLLWPIVFIMTDIINEYYGKKGVQFLSYLTVGLISYAFLMVYLAISAPPNAWWAFESGLDPNDKTLNIENMSTAFNKIFGQGLGIIIGSLVAFLIGQLTDVFVFHRIKKWTGEKMIWLRATGSTLISQLIDSYVVLIIAFYIFSDWELARVLAIGTVNYIYKFVMAIALTPLIYLGHSLIDRYLGAELADEMKSAASA